jgi:hypothetical protein
MDSALLRRFECVSWRLHQCVLSTGRKEHTDTAFGDPVVPLQGCFSVCQCATTRNQINLVNCKLITSSLSKDADNFCCNCFSLASSRHTMISRQSMALLSPCTSSWNLFGSAVLFTTTRLRNAGSAGSWMFPWEDSRNAGNASANRDV